MATLCHTTGPADRCAAAAGEKVGKTSARLPGPRWCWSWCSGKKLNRVFLLPAASPVAALLPGAVVSRRRFLQEISRKWLFSNISQPRKWTEPGGWWSSELSLIHSLFAPFRFLSINNLQTSEARLMAWGWRVETGGGRVAGP